MLASSFVSPLRLGGATLGARRAQGAVPSDAGVAGAAGAAGSTGPALGLVMTLVIAGLSARTQRQRHVIVGLRAEAEAKEEAKEEAAEESAEPNAEDGLPFSSYAIPHNVV